MLKLRSSRLVPHALSYICVVVKNTKFLTGMAQDPDVAGALDDALPLPEGADRVGATFGIVKITGVCSEQAFLLT